MREEGKLSWGDLIDCALTEKLTVGMPGKGERVLCSNAHYARMQEILGSRVRPVYRQRVRLRLALVGLLAAILMLCGCAVIVYGEGIGQLLFAAFTDRVEFTYAAQEEKTAHAAYQLGAVPQGYAYTADAENIGCAVYVTESGDWIRFEQDRKGQVIYTTDTDMTVEQAMVVEDRVVECVVVDGLHLYMWSQGADALRLVSNKPLTEDALAMMIGSLVAVQE